MLCVLKYGLLWRSFHGLMRGMCVLLYLGGIIYRCLLSSSDLYYLTDFFWGLGDLSIGESDILTSLSIIVFRSVCAITSSIICLCVIKLGMPMFCAYYFYNGNFFLIDGSIHHYAVNTSLLFLQSFVCSWSSFTYCFTMVYSLLGPPGYVYLSL